MSFEAQAWAGKLRVGNSSRKQVLDCLANCADQDGYCFPSIGYLVGRTELSRNTVIGALSALQNMGLLVKTKRQRENGSNRSNEYQLLLDVAEPKTMPPALELVPDSLPQKQGGDSAATALPLVQPLHYPSAATAPLESSLNRNLENTLTPRKRGGGGDLPGFERWWQTYAKSRRFEKAACEKIWRDRKLESRVDAVIRVLLADACSPQWTKDNGQFIPHAKRWLKREMYERELGADAGQESKACCICGQRGIFILAHRRYCEAHYVEVAA